MSHHSSEHLSVVFKEVDVQMSSMEVLNVKLNLLIETHDELIKNLREEIEKVAKDLAVADGEVRKAAVLVEEAMRKQEDSQRDLSTAEQALKATEEALNTLKPFCKKYLTELRSLHAPVAFVQNVMTALIMLTAPEGRIPKDCSWKAAKSMLMNVTTFHRLLVNFQKEDIHKNCLEAVRSYLQDSNLCLERIEEKSAAAGLYSWVINTIKFYDLYSKMESKRQAQTIANSELATAQDKLSVATVNANELKENLAKLRANMQRFLEKLAETTPKMQRFLEKQAETRANVLRFLEKQAEITSNVQRLLEEIEAR